MAHCVRCRGCGCRRVAPPWTVGRAAWRRVHPESVPWPCAACPPWSARLAHRHDEYAKWTGTVQIRLSQCGDVRDPGWERGMEATASAWEATGEQSGGGLSWGGCRAPDVLPPAVEARHGLSLTLAMAYLEPEMGRLHGKGKMLPDRGHPHGFGEGKIAPEHRHHRFDFEQRQVPSWAHPRPAPKGHEGLGRVAGAGL